MVKLGPMIVGFLLVGLFAISLITFGIRLADINQANQSIADSPAVSNYATQLNETLGTAGSEASSSQEALETSPTTLTTGIFIIDAIGGIWKTIITVPITVYNLTFGLAIATIFGGSAFGIVMSVIGAIVSIIIIIAVWRFVSTGDGG